MTLLERLFYATTTDEWYKEELKETYGILDANLKNEEKASVWLCSIAKNTYFAWYNEHKRLEPLDGGADIESPFDTEGFLENKMLAEKAFSVLHALEEPYKEVFMLSVFAGLSLKEISSLFGKSESWARVTFYRAKQKMAERMR